MSAERYVYRDGFLTVDSPRHLVSVHKTPVHVTCMQFDVLTLLTERADEVVTAGEIADKLDTNPTNVPWHVARLRKALRINGYNPILTVRGVGFRYVPPRVTFA